MNCPKNLNMVEEALKGLENIQPKSDIEPTSINKKILTSRADYISAAKDADIAYRKAVKQLQNKYIDLSKSKVQNLKALSSNKKYLKERGELIERFKKDYPINLSDANKRQWLKEAKSTPKLYHGTGSDITEFDPSKNIESVHNIKGIYTTTNPADAERYAETGRAPNIMPLIGRNENMLDVQRVSVPENIAKMFGIPEYKLSELKLKNGNYNIGKVLRASTKSNEENTEILKSLGATGLKDGGHYIFFNPSDIKSDFNSGGYSPIEKNILKSLVLPTVIIGSQTKDSSAHK